MFTDPIKLTSTLASILPSNGGFTEETFRLKDLNGGGSVRITTPTSGLSLTLKIQQQDTSEFKGFGTPHKRTTVRLQADYAGTPGDVFVQEAGYVQVTVTHPVGSAQVTPALLHSLFAQLAQLVLTDSDDPSANTAITVSTARFERLLAGES